MSKLTDPNSGHVKFLQGASALALIVVGLGHWLGWYGQSTPTYYLVDASGDQNLVHFVHEFPTANVVGSDFILHVDKALNGDTVDGLKAASICDSECNVVLHLSGPSGDGCRSWDDLTISYPDSSRRVTSIAPADLVGAQLVARDQGSVCVVDKVLRYTVTVYTEYQGRSADWLRQYGNCGQLGVYGGCSANEGRVSATYTRS